MPLYTYRCTTEGCEHSKEKIVKLSEREVPQDCSECDGEGTMNYEAFTAGDSGSNLYFRGNWFATTGRY